MSTHFILFIEHILDSIAEINLFVSNQTKEEFMKDKKTQYAVVRCLEMVGEATKKVSPDIKYKYSQVSWRDFAEMRDKLIHQYFGVDYDKVWNTVKDDLPVLKKQIKNILIKEITEKES